MKTHFIEDDIENAYGVDLDLHDYGDYLVLSSIKVPKSQRGLGLGTKAMEDIVEYADREGIDIYLTPDTSFGASSISRLKKFYQRFGFKMKPRSDFRSRNSMVRYASDSNA